MLKNKKLKKSAIIFLVFIVYTILVKIIDVQPIGPEDSEVGFATLNKIFAGIFTYSKFWYGVTDFLGNAAIFVCLGFAVVGCVQLIKRKNILKVDRDILILGAYYIVVILTYVIFNSIVVVNYRPVIIEFELEASYPSSHTLLAICVFATATRQLTARIKNKKLIKPIKITSLVLLCLTVFGRIFAGVHWISDIIGSLILSASYIYLYDGLISLNKKYGAYNKNERT